MDGEFDGKAEAKTAPAHGQRYAVTDLGGKLDVRKAGGGSAPEKEAELARADTRDLLALRRALSEFAVKLERGNDPEAHSADLIRAATASSENLNFSDLKHSFRRFETTPAGEKIAHHDVSFQLTYKEEDFELVGSLGGTCTLGSAPWRVLALTATGPARMRGEPGMEANGTMKHEVTYPDEPGSR